MKITPATVYLSLGSNLGDRRKNIAQALTRLAEQLVIVRYSSVYDTAPMDNPSQPRFLNMAVCARTTLAPERILALAKVIEAELGRQRTAPNHPRPIDIDILFYDMLIRKSPELIIPHPRLTRRAFVLVPLAEIAPYIRHPVTQQKVSDALKELRQDGQEVIKYEESGEIYV